MADLGLTHVALPVREIDVSLTFYAKYARMRLSSPIRMVISLNSLLVRKSPPL